MYKSFWHTRKRNWFWKRHAFTHVAGSLLQGTVSGLHNLDCRDFFERASKWRSRCAGGCPVITADSHHLEDTGTETCGGSSSQLFCLAVSSAEKKRLKTVWRTASTKKPRGPVKRLTATQIFKKSRSMYAIPRINSTRILMTWRTWHRVVW